MLRAGLTSERHRHAALFQGCFRYPELRGLLPPRPTGAVTCRHCRGRGASADGREVARLTGKEPPLCFCYGPGWLPAGTAAG